MIYDLGPRARRVYAALRERIRSAGLAPGARLPPHLRLAAEFGVAPMTVRQVLARLEQEGLVARERGRGTFVRAARAPSVLIVHPDPVDVARLTGWVAQAGFRALAASGPADGLAALEADPTIGLVLAGGGAELIRAVGRRWPALPVAVIGAEPGTLAELRRAPEWPVFSLPRPLRPGPVEEVLRLALPGGPPRAAPAALRAPRPPDAAALLGRYVAAQLAGDRRAALRLVLEEGLGGGLPPPALYLDVIQAAQHRIGELWQRNQIGVAQEHLATAVTQFALPALSAAAPRPPSNGRRVLVACVEGELHDIGARMVADLLDLSGFDVRDLGANVPTDSLMALVRAERPHLLVLSATMPSHLDRLCDAVARARAAEPSPDRLTIAVGGQAFTWVPGLAAQVGADLYGRDARESVALACRALRVEPPPATPGRSLG